MFLLSAPNTEHSFQDRMCGPKHWSSASFLLSRDRQTAVWSKKPSSTAIWLPSFYGELLMRYKHRHYFENVLISDKLLRVTKSSFHGTEVLKLHFTLSRSVLTGKKSLSLFIYHRSYIYIYISTYMYTYTHTHR